MADHTAYHPDGRYSVLSPFPAGLCQCGCGMVTPIAKRTDRSRGYVAGEHVRFAPGHSSRRAHWHEAPVNPTGLCECGCGQTTPIATINDRRKGWLKGEHVRFVAGHYDRTPSFTPPNPSGLCMCGCGRPTPIATRNRSDRGNVKGYPIRYCAGHTPWKESSSEDGEECACGCGQKATRGKKYRRGHQWRNKGYGVDSETGCWLWKGFVNKAGYGRIHLMETAREILAHRYVWEDVNGPVPHGMELHHKCGVKSCVNPKHLTLVTRREHIEQHMHARKSG
jgi:hypothetical protein